MTPWTDDDLAARILNAEKNVELIRLPVEAEENDPLGREAGDALCPELGKDNCWLADFKANYISDPQGGQRAWTALYQCSPRTEEGNLVLRNWWKYYDPEEPVLFATELISVDASFRGEDDSDFVSIQVWGKKGQDYYLRYCLNKRLNFPDTVTALRTVYRLFPRARAVLIERAANGQAVIDTLQKEMFILPVNPKGGKISRVNAVSPAIESGHVFLPEPAKAPWVADYVDQWTAFPNSRHDDMVDASSQALHAMIYYNGDVWEQQEREPEIDLVRFYDPYSIERSTAWMF